MSPSNSGSVGAPAVPTDREPTPEIVAAVTWACGIASLHAMAAEWVALAGSARLAGLDERFRQAAQAVEWLRTVVRLAEEQRSREPEATSGHPVDLVFGSLIGPMVDADCAIHWEAIKGRRGLGRAAPSPSRDGDVRAEGRDRVRRGITVMPHAVRAARLAAGLSLAGLAEPEYTRGLMYQIESGRTRPSISSLRHIATRTGRPLEFFLPPGSPLLTANAGDDRLGPDALPAELPTMAARLRWIVDNDYADEGTSSRLPLLALAAALDAAADVIDHEPPTPRVRVLRDRMAELDAFR